jgi:RNA polymerase sigma factor (sigma-70 family)
MGGRLEFESFYAAEFQRVYKAIYLTCGDREIAQDVTQEAFKLAFVRWRRLRDEPWAGGWVMTTALNLMRKDRKRPGTVELEPAAMPPMFDSSEQDLLEALRALPYRQRSATLLYYLGDLPVHGVAEVMGIADGTVKALLSQARHNLRDTLGGSDG